jgi:hypothetical protein
MRWLLLIVPLLMIAGCDKPIHEARAPINWAGSNAR